jgi:quercetin dioxygenase-like cupin family protein
MTNEQQMHASTSGPFVRTEDTDWQELGNGVRRQILGYGPDLMMVRVDFQSGAIGALHHHPHRQVTYVAEGTFEITVGDEQETLGPGDCFYAQADVPHGVRAIDGGTLIDVFTPVRADFLG